MVEFTHPQFSTLLSRLNEKPRRIIYVFGPRQVGKTTLVKQTLHNQALPFKFVSTDEPYSIENTLNPDFDPTQENRDLYLLDSNIRDGRWLVREWEKARTLFNKSEKGFILAIDEIQKIPNWSEIVKGLWDADRRKNQQFHVILLGSAPLLMQKGLNESLAGRFETIQLMHWSFSEMLEAFEFDLDQFIYFGGYPEAAYLVSDQDRWREYITEAIIEPNIEKDILKLQRVAKPALLKKLFHLGTDYSGQILSYNKMLGQLDDAGNTTTLARYLELLSMAGLITGLETYSLKPYRIRSSSPKLNVFNTALISASSDYSFSQAKSDRSYWGHLVESAVGAHLLNTRKYNTKLYYWREKYHEVDFVLKVGPDLIAIEVKSGARKPNLDGLFKFKERFQPTKSFIVGEGGIPFSEFFMTPADELLEIE
ncbi:MAG: ATP-binding protein [Rhodobacteraceae bacterium]|nr:ATP-binding protein [Paracoccaceae bacterium]